MAVQRYDKLVRDKIPVIIEAKGKSVIAHVADDTEYWTKLKEKLQEEAAEFTTDDSVEELADLLEVIEAILIFKKIDRSQLEELRQRKAVERGGFEKRIVLETVEEDD